MFLRNCFYAGVACLAIVPSSRSQEPVDRPNVSITSTSNSKWVSIVHIPAVPNAPFSATTMMDNIRPLPDGTSVTTTTMTTIARDSKGRTHNENRFYLTPADNGDGRIRDITIFDPIARTRTTLNPATLQASIVDLPPPEHRSGAKATAPQPDVEDLGVSFMAGLTVHGFRQTHTIPEGGEGNDRSITITDENWHSDELHMNLSVKHTDPRHGTQTMILTQIKRDEPDPALFEIPAGYAVPGGSTASGTTRISAGIAESNLIDRVDPVYPPLALAARIQGSVTFDVLIGEDGLVKTAQLVRGHPLLVNAAKEAVVQWKYRPTLLNGKAVSVMAPVVINFTAAGNQ